MKQKFLIIYRLMDPADKRRLLLIFSLSLVNGLVNVLGIASVLPFIGAISDPEIIANNLYIQKFKSFFSIESDTSLIIALGLISFVMILLSNIISALDAWISTHFSFHKEQQLSERLLSVYLNMQVREFQKLKAAEKVKNVLADIDRIILDTLDAMIDMATNSIVALAIFILLLVVDVKASLFITGLIVSIYCIAYFSIANKLSHLGEDYTGLETRVYQQVMQALRLHKTIKVSGKQAGFVKSYRKAFEKMRSNRMRYELLSLVPQHVIEVLAFGSLLIISLYFYLVAPGDYSTIAMIGLYAFAAYRLMPSVSAIFDGFEQIQFGSASLKRLVNQLYPKSKGAKSPVKLEAPVSHLSIENIGFEFDSADRFCLWKINVEFVVNGFNCIKGKTGCGKSTLLNILGGFYQPSAGEILVNGKPVPAFENPGWWQQLGIVDDDVNLSDASIIENIAFGIPHKKIDTKRVSELCRLVELDGVIAELPKGFKTKGDRLQRLSRGQKFKLAIARALYHQPQLLLLDEATDAFDKDTESRIINRLKAINNLTVVISSHRQSVHQHADLLIDLEVINQQG